MKKRTLILAAATAAAFALPAFVQAQIAISANDGKQLRPGELPATRTPDSVSILQIGNGTASVLGSIPVAASMIGPPTSVALAGNGSFALVTSAQTVEDGTIVTNDELSVVDLANPRAPVVLQKISAGPGATGVAINPEMTLALVACTGDDSIWVYRIEGKRLAFAGRVRMPYQSRPTDVAFGPDGKMALAVLQSASRIVRLDVAGDQVRRSGVEYSPGRSPYGVVVTRDGRHALNTNLGGRMTATGGNAGPGTIGTISVADLATNTVVGEVDVGMTPEHVTLSPDGRYAAVVVANGSAAQPGSPTYHEYGLLQIYRLDGASLTRVAEAHTGKWCQGAVFSTGNDTVLLQCAMDKQIEVYRFSGAALTRDDGATITLGARPGAIAIAAGR